MQDRFQINMYSAAMVPILISMIDDGFGQLRENVAKCMM